MLTYESWGRYHKFQHQIRFITHHTDTLPLDSESRVLPYGLGRSYGDSCLNDGGTLIDTHHMHRFLAFDPHQGIIRCEAGCSLAEILQFIVPRGWFLPVTPGTKFVTLGGAIANDVHGKNHHRAGNFGHHVRQFELLRSDGKRYLCSSAQNSDLFRATIGGLGLTGLITWAEFHLKPIQSPYIDVEVIKFKNLDEFFALSSESEAGYDYIVSWIDCLATGKHLGKGLFTRGNNAVPPFTGPIPAQKADSLLMAPFDAPNFILNKLTVRLFNFVYYHKQRQRLVQQLSHYDPFFYPLDRIGHWNRIYGQRGFMQHQCVVPYEGDDRAIRTIIDKIARSGLGTFLVVLKPSAIFLQSACYPFHARESP